MFVPDVQQCAAPALQEQYSPPATAARVLSGERWTCVTAENVGLHSGMGTHQIQCVFQRHWVYNSRVIDTLAMCTKYEATWKNLTYWTLPKCQNTLHWSLTPRPYSMPEQGVRVYFGFSYQGKKFFPWGKWAQTTDLSATTLQSIALCNLYATQSSERFGPSCQFLFAK